MMTVHLHGDDLHGDRRSAMTCVGDLGAAITAIYRNIAASTMRHLERARPSHRGDGGEPSLEHDLTRYPQAPLILGDKWDF